MKMTFKKSLVSGFQPDDEASQRLYDRAKPGDLITVDAVLPRDQRSLRQHNLYFKIIAHVFDNLPETVAAECPSTEVLRERLLISIGFSEDIYYGPIVGTQKRAKSLAHSKLDQSEFHDQVWEPSVRLINKMAPGLGDAFNREYDAYMEGR